MNTIDTKLRKYLLVNFILVVEEKLEIEDYIEGMNLILGYDINEIAGNIMSLDIDKAVLEYKEYPEDIYCITINERIDVMEIIDEMIIKITNYLYN
jgi:hypothetical protein